MKIAETIYTGTPLSKKSFFTCSDCVLQISEFLFNRKIAEISFNNWKYHPCYNERKYLQSVTAGLTKRGSHYRAILEKY